MNAVLHNELVRCLGGIFAPRIELSASAWCERFLVFDEPDNRGPFSLIGREYAREPLDSFSLEEVTDGILLFGSQSGKTGILMGGTAYTVVNRPSRVIWVMPNEHLAQSFSETRWMPLIRRSETTSALLPTGARRHDVKKLQQFIGDSVVNFFGSNSPANLSSTPARVAIQDEVDKFSAGTAKEADAVSLADQRTKKFSNPKRYKSSTPTMTDGLIWQEFLKTDQRRRFVPCPNCGKHVVFVWSKEMTVFPSVGCEAFIRWDKEAKRSDRTWDLDRVEQSARAECPHCGFHIRDGMKTAMDRAGEWRATQSAARGYRGWHLSSLYANGTETTFGKLAVKFLQAKQSLLGLQGFINGDLAEPWESQDSRSERTEVIVTDGSQIADALRIMTVDVQEVSPYFWVVIRDWARGPSRLRWFGSVDRWEDVRELQIQHSIQDDCVVLDSGNQTQTVYDNCLRWGKLVPRGNGMPIWHGWLPSKGRERDAKWADPKTKAPRPFILGRAALPHKRLELPLLEFNGDAIKDVLATLRKRGKPYAWELNEAASEEYFRHIDAEIKQPLAVGRTGKITWQWCKRNSRWPNHGLDCEIMQIAAAVLKRRFVWAIMEQPKNEHSDNDGKTPQA